jgi:hypothetical protein
VKLLRLGNPGCQNFGPPVTQTWIGPQVMVSNVENEGPGSTRLDGTHRSLTRILYTPLKLKYSRSVDRLVAPTGNLIESFLDFID